jgi:DNA-binding response OmpR family regulator
MWAPNLSKARSIITTENVDMIILDIVLPDGDGIDFCYTLQETKCRAPIIVLTSHDDISKKILSFSAGVDDYIIRPFHKIELQAKLNSKLRNYSLQSKENDTLKWKEIQIIKSKQEITLFDDKSARQIELTGLEFKILTLFTNYVGTVLSRDTILNRVWGKNVFVSPHSVDTHVSKLRKKLGQISHIIQSIHGTGYMFCPTVITEKQ